MDRSVLALGGVLIMAGGVVYLLKDYFINGPSNGPACDEGTTKCIGADLYICQNGKWVLYKKNEPECKSPCTGDCGAEGWTKCDGNTLCVCDGGRFRILEQNSSKCVSGVYHKQCFVDQNGFSVCLRIPGSGTDKCWGKQHPYPYGSEGCSCTPPKKCYDEHWCEPNYELCMNLAWNIWIEAYLTGGDVHDTVVFIKDVDPSGDLAVGANRLLGHFEYKWATPLDSIDMYVFAGIGDYVERIYYKRHTIWGGGDGTIHEDITFARQGVEWLHFIGVKQGFTVKFTSFKGNLMA